MESGIPLLHTKKDPRRISTTIEEFIKRNREVKANSKYSKRYTLAISSGIVVRC